MSDLHDARKQTKALLPFARAVLAQDKALDELVDIERATATAEAARAAAVQSKTIVDDELARAQSLRDGALAELEAATSAIAGKIAEGEGIVRTANEQANSINVNALAAAAARVKAGDDEAAKIISDAEDRAAAISAATGQATEALEGVLREVAAANQRLADTNAEIERLRTLFAPK